MCLIDTRRWWWLRISSGHEFCMSLSLLFRTKQRTKMLRQFLSLSLFRNQTSGKEKSPRYRETHTHTVCVDVSACSSHALHYPLILKRTMILPGFDSYFSLPSFSRLTSSSEAQVRDRDYHTTRNPPVRNISVRVYLPRGLYQGTAGESYTYGKSEWPLVLEFSHKFPAGRRRAAATQMYVLLTKTTPSSLLLIRFNDSPCKIMLILRKQRKKRDRKIDKKERGSKNIA